MICFNLKKLDEVWFVGVLSDLCCDFVFETKLGVVLVVLV